MISSEKIDKKYLANLINNDNPIIFDIGCYDGRDGLEFIPLFKNPQVFAFDPSPCLTNAFKESLKANSNLVLTEVALTDIDGNIDLYEADKHPASNSTKRPKDHLIVFSDVEFSKVSTTKSSKLDTWVEKNLKDTTIDLMWIDVNGAEKEFLLGAKETLLEKTKLIFIEFSAVGDQQLYEGSCTREDILSFFEGFEELGTYDFKGNFGNILLRKTI
jgi:FkbM family methyltransferase